MLYQFHETTRSLLSPFVYWSHANARMFSEPGSWLSRLPGAERVADRGQARQRQIGRNLADPGHAGEQHEGDGRGGRRERGGGGAGPGRSVHAPDHRGSAAARQRPAPPRTASMVPARISAIPDAATASGTRPNSIRSKPSAQASLTYCQG